MADVHMESYDEDLPMSDVEPSEDTGISVSDDEELAEEESDGDLQSDGDLATELNEILSERCGLNRRFCYCSTAPDAPNPGIVVDGVGFIGLPLSDRDAKLIMAAPCGKSNGTLAREIFAANVSFTNPKWDDFVECLGSITAPTALGIAQCTPKFRCELSKLILCPPGVQLTPSQGGSKEDGTFATIVVILPSPFEGGDVHVSHEQQTRVLSVFESSAFETSILTWHTDAAHEVMPITSGYRLALSYNLIHVSTEAPRPSLPDISDDLNAIRRVFRKWRDNKYTDIPSNPPLIAYLLHHTYGSLDLRRGVECLTGFDAPRTAYLLPIAKESGFVVSLAHLKYTQTGSADSEYLYSHDGWDGESDDEGSDIKEGTPEIYEVHWKTTEISNFVCIRGGVASWPGSFKLSHNNIVPGRPFEDTEHDSAEYHISGVGGITHIWERSVLVFFQEKDEITTMLRIGGFDWASQELQSKTDYSDEIASQVLVNLARQEVKVLKRGRRKIITLTLLNYAASGKDASLWNKAVPYCRYIRSSLGDVLKNALEVFDLDSITPGLLDLVEQAHFFRGRSELAKIIERHVPDAGELVAGWIDALIKDASRGTLDVSGVPNLVWIAHKRGFESVKDILTRSVTAVPGLKARFEVVKSIQAQLGEDSVSAWVDDLMKDAVSSSDTVASAEDIPTLLWISTKVGVESTLKILNDIAMKTRGLKERFELVKGIQESVGEDAISAWVDQMMKDSVSDYTAASLDDIPTMLWITQRLGLEKIQNTLITNFSEWPNKYEFLVAFAKMLDENRQRFSQVTTPVQPDHTEPGRSAVDVSETIRQCIMGAIPQWAVSSAAPSHGTPPLLNGAECVNRICELVESCFVTIRSLTPCTTLLAAILRVPDDSEICQRVKTICVPLVPRLRRILEKHGMPITAEPFGTFFKILISLYVVNVLGRKPRDLPPITRRVRCDGCAECKRLEAFLKDSAPNLALKVAQAQRKHIEERITAARIPHMVSYETIRRGTPYTLSINKSPELIAVNTWKEKQQAALNFLGSISDDEVLLETIMGDRFGDVKNAVQGTALFAPVPIRLMEVTPADVPVAVSFATSSGAGTTAVHATVPVAGVKRKQPDHAQDDVIDLT